MKTNFVCPFKFFLARFDVLTVTTQHGIQGDQKVVLS